MVQAISIKKDIVWKIQERFGQEFIHENENGNLAIGKDVLKEFRKLTEGKRRVGKV